MLERSSRTWSVPPALARAHGRSVEQRALAQLVPRLESISAWIQTVSQSILQPKESHMPAHKTHGQKLPCAMAYVYCT